MLNIGMSLGVADSCQGMYNTHTVLSELQVIKNLSII